MATNASPGSLSGWERWNDALVGWCAYVTLAVGIVLSLLLGGVRTTEGLVTLAIALGAVAWVYVMYTRCPVPRKDHRVRLLVFFVGLLVLASILMIQQPLFFIFMISGFFYATALRPIALAVVGVAATSILINSLIAGIPTSAEAWTFWAIIVSIQTIAIGFGAVIGEKISEQSEERRLAVERLEVALEENAGLHAQLLTQAREAGVLDERGRMAREIHDTIAHGLTGIVTQLEAAEQAEDRPEDRQRHAANAIRLARESLAEARRSVEASRPASLESGSLPAALGEVAEQWSTMTGIPVALTTTGEVVPLNPEIELALLRTAQEALANVAKHASATRAGLTLSYMGDVVTLDVRDDGVGFDVPETGAPRDAGFGLTAMRQRVSRVAGTLAIESEPGGGTAISARVPAITAQAAGSEP